MERIRSGLRIPYDLNTWLIEESRKQGMAKNALILQILWDWVKRIPRPLGEGWKDFRKEVEKWITM